MYNGDYIDINIFQLIRSFYIFLLILAIHLLIFNLIYLKIYNFDKKYIAF